MSMNPVNFQHKNGVMSAMNKIIAETLEARGEGKIIKGTPEPRADFVKNEKK